MYSLSSKDNSLIYVQTCATLNNIQFIKYIQYLTPKVYIWWDEKYHR